MQYCLSLSRKKSLHKTLKGPQQVQSQRCIGIPCIRKSGAGFVSRVDVLWHVYGNGNQTNEGPWHLQA